MHSQFNIAMSKNNFLKNYKIRKKIVETTFLLIKLLQFFKQFRENSKNYLKNYHKYITNNLIIY